MNTMTIFCPDLVFMPLGTCFHMQSYLSSFAEMDPGGPWNRLSVDGK
jgi:hypothetical protein